MSTVQEIQNAVRDLSDEDLTAFRRWFAEFDATSWDKQLEADVASGRLDRLADEALRDRLEQHLAILRRQGLVEAWHDRRIQAGSAVDDSIVELEETLRLTSICGLGQVALGPVTSVLGLERGGSAARPQPR